MFHSCLPHLGAARAERLYRFASMLHAGASLEFGSDWPVSSADPLLGLAVATQRNLGGDSATQLDANERLEVAQAMKLYATEEPTDFVVLSVNPLMMLDSDLCVLETIIGGQTMFTRQ